MSQNTFFSYWTEKSDIGYFVGCNDTKGNEHKIVLCPTKEIAEYLENHFDNLAMDEEKDLFGKAYLSTITKHEIAWQKAEQCERCGTKDLPCFCNDQEWTTQNPNEVEN